MFPVPFGGTMAMPICDTKTGLAAEPSTANCVQLDARHRAEGEAGEAGVRESGRRIEGDGSGLQIRQLLHPLERYRGPTVEVQRIHPRRQGTAQVGRGGRGIDIDDDQDLPVVGHCQIRGD